MTESLSNDTRLLDPVRSRPCLPGCAAALPESGRVMALPRLGGTLLAFGLLTWIVTLPMAHRWDVLVTVWLQRAVPAPDLPAAALVLAAVFLWRRDRQRSATALWLAGGVAVVGLVAVGLKLLIVHPGPPPSLQRVVLNAGLHLST